MTHASTIDLVRTTVSVGEGGALRVGRPMHAGTLSLFPLYHAEPPVVVRPLYRRRAHRTSGRHRGGRGGLRARPRRRQPLQRAGAARRGGLHHGRGHDIGRLVAGLRPRRGQRGVVAAIAGEVVCVDLFDRGRTLRHLWPSLIGSYAADALIDPTAGLRPLGRADVLAWLAALAGAEATVHPAPGLGDTVALTGVRVAATALVHGGSVVHVTAFPVVS